MVIAVAAAEAEEASAAEVAAVVVTVVALAVVVEEGELQEGAEVTGAGVAVEAAEEVEVPPKLLLLNLIATTESSLHVVKKMLWLP